MSAEQEAELRYYRELLGAVCVFYEASQALDNAPDDPEDERTVLAWNRYQDAEQDLFDFVRCEEHAAAMEAAGVTCNELHHSRVTPSA